MQLQATSTTTQAHILSSGSLSFCLFLFSSFLSPSFPPSKTPCILPCSEFLVAAQRDLNCNFHDHFSSAYNASTASCYPQDKDYTLDLAYKALLSPTRLLFQAGLPCPFYSVATPSQNNFFLQLPIATKYYQCCTCSSTRHADPLILLDLMWSCSQPGSHSSLPTTGRVKDFLFSAHCFVIIFCLYRLLARFSIHFCAPLGLGAAWIFNKHLLNECINSRHGCIFCFLEFYNSSPRRSCYCPVRMGNLKTRDSTLWRSHCGRAGSWTSTFKVWSILPVTIYSHYFSFHFELLGFLSQVSFARRWENFLCGPNVACTASAQFCTAFGLPSNWTLHFGLSWEPGRWVMGEQEDSGMRFLPSRDSHAHCGNKIHLVSEGPWQKVMGLCWWQDRLFVLLEGARNGSIWMWVGDTSLKELHFEDGYDLGRLRKWLCLGSEDERRYDCVKIGGGKPK